MDLQQEDIFRRKTVLSLGVCVCIFVPLHWVLIGMLISSVHYVIVLETGLVGLGCIPITRMHTFTHTNMHRDTCAHVAYAQNSVFACGRFKSRY